MKAALAIVSVIGLSAVVAAILIGRSTFDGTVVDRPYERGLQYDAVLKEKAASGWSVNISSLSFHTGRDELLIEVTDRQGLPLDAAGVTVVVSRPSTAAYDRTYAATKIAPGKFRTELTLPLYGYWDAKIQVTREKHTITFEQRIFAVKEKK